MENNQNVVSIDINYTSRYDSDNEVIGADVPPQQLEFVLESNR